MDTRFRYTRAAWLGVALAATAAVAIASPPVFNDPVYNEPGLHEPAKGVCGGSVRCKPNRSGFGYYRPTWRRWPGEVRTPTPGQAPTTFPDPSTPSTEAPNAASETESRPRSRSNEPIDVPPPSVESGDLPGGDSGTDSVPIVPSVPGDTLPELPATDDFPTDLPTDSFGPGLETPDAGSDVFGPSPSDAPDALETPSEDASELFDGLGKLLPEKTRVSPASLTHAQVPQRLDPRMARASVEIVPQHSNPSQTHFVSQKNPLRLRRGAATVTPLEVQTQDKAKPQQPPQQAQPLPQLTNEQIQRLAQMHILQQAARQIAADFPAAQPKVTQQVAAATPVPPSVAQPTPEAATQATAIPSRRNPLRSN